MREKMISGNVYHVLNRGVDKRTIFVNDRDYLRFIHDLFEFNDTVPPPNLNYHFNKSNSAFVRPNIKRELLVEILAFVLMPNHYHLLLRPRFDDGVTRFMKKLNMGYALYFNGKYDRSGSLFQGRYKSISVDSETHLTHLPYYIHFNPLDLKYPEWRNRKLSNYKQAIKYLNSYRWSSFLDYSGQKNFPSVTQRDFLTKFSGGPNQLFEDMIQWLKDVSLSAVEDVLLE